MLFVQALLVALWVTWAMIDEQTLQLQTTRAIITGVVVGIIMGDLQTGLIVATWRNWATTNSCRRNMWRT